METCRVCKSLRLGSQALEPKLREVGRLRIEILNPVSPKP